MDYVIHHSYNYPTFNMPTPSHAGYGGSQDVEMAESYEAAETLLELRKGRRNHGAWRKGTPTEEASMRKEEDRPSNLTGPDSLTTPYPLHRYPDEVDGYLQNVHSLCIRGLNIIASYDTTCSLHAMNSASGLELWTAEVFEGPPSLDEVFFTSPSPIPEQEEYTQCTNVILACIEMVLKYTIEDMVVSNPEIRAMMFCLERFLKSTEGSGCEPVSSRNRENEFELCNPLIMRWHMVVQEKGNRWKNKAEWVRHHKIQLMMVVGDEVARLAEILRSVEIQRLEYWKERAPHMKDWKRIA